MPEEIPALVLIRPSWTYSAASRTRAAGYRSRIAAVSDQCVVQARPSRSPASPRTAAPLHTEATRAPASYASRTQRTAARGTRRSDPVSRGPGTRTRSPGYARVRASGASPSSASPCADLTFSVSAVYSSR